ncbi:phosphoribosylpyrophosphate synthetase [Mucilaginibacter agri]|uniref:Phosphoribosylpyrophosphate synthetase n=1 Tax=Mucilaginibacter agri TaxID=2695265 RepID=A0A966DWL0_9SPHI|nr:phosphoribosylpyrophosphate synthetase [Mucilaginibacter agri]NCD71499.1 phosphoribosylpyrophosphate synthetase [Mucilaginibacter agri]
MENYATKTEAIIALQERGYDQDFVLKDEYLFYVQQSELMKPDDFEITETYRFEGHRRLCDNYVIYGICTVDSDIKGILMTPYSAYGKGVSIRLWSKLANTLK